MKIEDFKKKFKNNDKLAIVGTASTWKEAPYDSDDYDIWGLNGLHGFFGTPDSPAKASDFDLWFNIHDIEGVRKQETHMAFLNSGKVPVVMKEHYSEVPKSIKYPWQQILNRYRHYHESTFSWLVCLAMEMGYKQIDWYGTHLSSEDEYRNQRPNLEYYIGLAEGRGIKIDIPSDADILQSRILYAVEEKGDLEKKFDNEIEGLRERAQGIKNQRDQLSMQLERYKGAIDRDKYWRRILTGK